MDTDASVQKPARRKHNKAFKAQILRACAEPGASLAGIAIEHGLNPNRVQRWRREARRGELVLPGAAQFIPIVAASGATTAGQQAAPNTQPPMIQVQVQRGAVQARISWPVQAGGDCAAWLCELFR